MQKIMIGIQPLAELRAEMLAVARGERKADPDAPKVRFQSLEALAKALQTDVATVKRVLMPAPPSTDDDVLDERQDFSGGDFGPREIFNDVSRGHPTDKSNAKR
jgi:hypothetical protein